MSTPNNDIPYVPENTLDPAAGLNLALDIIDALLQTAVISMSLTAPPGTPDDGDLYIVNGPATGSWAGLEDKLVRYRAEGTLWQSFDAKLIVNLADGGLYKYIPGSPGGWTLAAGLSDAPTDGNRYVRRLGVWEALFGTITIKTPESPPDVSVEDVVELLTDPATLTLLDLGGNAASLAVRPPIVTTEAGTALTALPAHRNRYTRFTNAAAKTYTFDGNEAYAIGDEFHGRNVGAGDLTLTLANGFIINVPSGGGMVIPAGGTFTVKIVATDEADLFGVTQA